ncbi:MAG: CBS domain-containing protein [Chloroflexi bacterium]|nr:CBS domain-containing protein [Chloroflexota bacterium]
MKNEPVIRWMSKEPITIGPKTTLPEAHNIMIAQKIRRLPVVNEAGHLVGIVTLGDVREASPSDATSLSIYELNYLLAKLTIDRVMTREPIAITPETTLSEAAQLMLKHKIGGLPVIAHGKVVGIITESDIFRVLVKALGEG